MTEQNLNPVTGMLQSYGVETQLRNTVVRHALGVLYISAHRLLSGESAATNDQLSQLNAFLADTRWREAVNKDVIQKLDLESSLGQADRDLLVQAVQALHAQRVAAWRSQNAHANLVGQVAINPGAFGIDEAALMLRRLGAGPSVL